MCLCQVQGVAGAAGAGEVQLISCVCQSLYFTSQSRKDQVVMKDVMLGRSSCRPEGDTDQTVQKLGWGRVMVLISILACLATARTSLATTSCPVPVRAAQSKTRYTASSLS